MWHICVFWLSEASFILFIFSFVCQYSWNEKFNEWFAGFVFSIIIYILVFVELLALMSMRIQSDRCLEILFFLSSYAFSGVLFRIMIKWTRILYLKYCMCEMYIQFRIDSRSNGCMRAVDFDTSRCFGELVRNADRLHSDFDKSTTTEASRTRVCACVRAYGKWRYLAVTQPTKRIQSQRSSRAQRKANE